MPGQRCIEQGRNFFAVEESPIFNNVENSSRLPQKLLEFAIVLSFARLRVALHAGEPVRPMIQRIIFDLQHVHERVRRVSGHKQRRLPG